MGKINQAVRKILIGLISLYGACVSPFLGQRCRFYPTCSVYAKHAIETHGIIIGIYLAVRRLFCCHPLHPGGVDEVPSSLKKCNGLNRSIDRHDLLHAIPGLGSVYISSASPKCQQTLVLPKKVKSP